MAVSTKTPRRMRAGRPIRHSHNGRPATARLPAVHHLRDVICLDEDGLAAFEQVFLEAKKLATLAPTHPPRSPSVRRQINRSVKFSLRFPEQRRWRRRKITGAVINLPAAQKGGFNHAAQDLSHVRREFMPVVNE